MLEQLVTIHNQVMASTPAVFKRYLFDKINWKSKAICIQGDRGVGKTTLVCQYFLENYVSVDKAIYISADNIHVTKSGLFAIAQEYFSFGGEALIIDEVHKYPNWAIELKNIIDTYRKHQIIFTGSSSLDLKQSKSDLSRRVVFHQLLGLSFREYLKFAHDLEFSTYEFDHIINNHAKIADQFKAITILKHFYDYLNYGYYPFFLEGVEDYLIKTNNIIEKVIFEDIAVVYNLKQATLPIMKKLLWLVATANGLIPNIDRISRNLGTSREIIYHCLEYLSHAGLINNVYSDGRGMKLIRKPAKIYLHNTNLLYAVNGNLKLYNDIGAMRETFFVNQVLPQHLVSVHNSGDFLVDGKYVIEIGGKGKTNKQIKSIKDAYLAIDNIEIGFGKRIPLYLFGFFY
jgi:uncharacterized protein